MFPERHAHRVPRGRQGRGVPARDGRAGVRGLLRRLRVRVPRGRDAPAGAAARAQPHAAVAGRARQ